MDNSVIRKYKRRQNVFYETQGGKYKLNNDRIESCSTSVVESDISSFIIDFNLRRIKSIGRKEGLYPEELLACLQGTDKYKEIGNISDLETLTNDTDSDFLLCPIYKEKHFLTAIVNFKEDGNRDIYIFDSEQKLKDLYISTKDGLSKNPGILCTENLQKESGLCWLFTIEFIKKASSYDNFNGLEESFSDGSMQEYLVNKVKEILNGYRINFDELKANGNISLEHVKGTGLGKRTFVDRVTNRNKSAGLSIY